MKRTMLRLINLLLVTLDVEGPFKHGVEVNHALRIAQAGEVEPAPSVHSQEIRGSSFTYPQTGDPVLASIEDRVRSDH